MLPIPSLKTNHGSLLNGSIIQGNQLSDIIRLTGVQTVTNINYPRLIKSCLQLALNDGDNTVSM